MSRNEPSYYEIALTQRQVVIAFVIVLVCLLASFFLGVWVGQGGSIPEPVQQVQGGSDEADDAAEDDGKLRFFSENGEAADVPEPRDEPEGTSTTLREDLDRGTPPVEPSPEPGRPEPREPPREEPRPTTPPPQRTEPVQPSPTRTDLPPGSEGFVVQVFSSPDQAQAQKVLDQLTRADQDAFLLPQEISGEVMYRVRVGPFETREQAERVAARVERELGLDTWVTQ